MVPETVIRHRDVDAAEIVKRLEGCVGYLSSRAASGLNNPEKTRQLQGLLRAIQTALQEVRHFEVAVFHRTESAPSRR